ncbi:hypothetical protein SK854_41820 [Lentzea sp. BCCO 10_0061]|uniref:UvrD-like helicase C-terminal domain-containing protein n=1 Tax=Lentzea sokolovensis TaxID=3095429 RepID=A0ABU4VBZ6_9PSEU|nr:hypothetical protein [Lentzea sp. BCCO 10_0061]MDX8148714.1 hypothetical protein [Lentzea sp. BCCO 10_0061]
MSEVMAIGPFRDIANQVRPWCEDYPGLIAGTVHASQGKQADRPGARRWAASKPNLLNVAVSRAKHRLHVTGARRRSRRSPRRC